MRIRARQSWFVAIAIAILALTSFGAAGVDAATVSVAAMNYQFSPASRTVHVGDTLTWRMSGDPHTVTSGTVDAGGVGHASSGPLHSPLIFPGGRYSYKFTKAGTYPYFCKIHADTGMKGTIRVVAAAPTPTPTPRPTQRPTPRPTPPSTPTARPTPSPTAAVAVSPTPILTSSAAAVGAPEPTTSPLPPPVATPSPGPGNEPGPAADATPFTVAGILLVIAIFGAMLLRARRKA